MRYEDPQAERAAVLTLTLAKLGGAAVLGGFVLLGVKAARSRSSSSRTAGPS